MSELTIFRPTEILARLVEAGVRFVVIGGLAAQAHGSPSVTEDLDICHARDPDNLATLADVLAELMATRRGLPADAPPMPPLDVRTLRAASLFRLSTRYGALDLLAAPDPGLEFAALDRNAREATVAGIPVRIASLEDLMAMKRAAGRPKDLIELEVLGALRDEIDRSG